MRRKFFQDLANTLPEMLMGWRMGEDLAAILDLADSIIHFDLIEGRATCGDSAIDLWVAGELATWLRDTLEKRGVPNAFDEAVLRADVRKEGLGVVSLIWEIESELRSGQDVYRGRARDVHRWHMGPVPN